MISEKRGYCKNVVREIKTVILCQSKIIEIAKLKCPITGKAHSLKKEYQRNNIL
jgi:hypothetical protein